ncbi:MAG: hypothetical protein AMXMBFR46_16970 [Acidimicrobiia bacterium]
MPGSDDIEYDATAAQTWMLAVASGEATALTVDDDTGLFGSRVALLDFDAADLTHILGLVPSTRLAPSPEIESAISISGSSAQGRIQLFPGDTDFFERVHIRAPDEASAHRILREAMHRTATRAFVEPDIVLVETNLGVYPEAVDERGRKKAAGDSIEWTPADVVARQITVTAADGTPRTYHWDEVELTGGWLYFGWVAADRTAGRIVFTSNMIDATWEDDDGVVHSIDGAVDQLAQEIYLEPEALPLVERLHGITPPGARDAYRNAMRGEVHHYTAEEPNYAKAAKRLYNLFRVADELEAAAYVRELFDEPAARLYQVPVLLFAADVALDPQSGIDRETVRRQLDLVATAIADATDGGQERELLGHLARLAAQAEGDGARDGDWASVLDEVRTRCAEIVSDYFREQLHAHERVRTILEEIQAG